MSPQAPPYDSHAHISNATTMDLIYYADACDVRHRMGHTRQKLQVAVDNMLSCCGSSSSLERFESVHNTVHPPTPLHPPAGSKGPCAAEAPHENTPYSFSPSPPTAESEAPLSV